jgi:hypothetical protein
MLHNAAGGFRQYPRILEISSNFSRIIAQMRHDKVWQKWIGSENYMFDETLIRCNIGQVQEGICLPYRFVLGSFPVCAVFIPLTILVAIIGAVSEAAAASDAECQLYADSAVDQNKENNNLGCKFRSERWHRNRTAHFLFCKAVGSDLSDLETGKRATKLARCRDALAANENNENQPGRVGPEVAGDAEDGISNELADEANDTPVSVCKATLTRAMGSSSGRPEQEWRALVKLWEADSQKRYGEAFGDYTNAKNKSIKCNPDLFNSQNFVCKIRAKPCNN